MADNFGNKPSFDEEYGPDLVSVVDEEEDYYEGEEEE